MSLNKKVKEDFKEKHTTYQYNRLHILPQTLLQSSDTCDEQDQLQSLKLSSVLGPLYLKKFFNSCKKNKIILPEEVKGITVKQPRLKKWDKYEHDLKTTSNAISNKKKRVDTEGSKFCPSCGNLRIHGVNTTHRLVETNGDKYSTLECLLCKDTIMKHQVERPQITQITPIVTPSNTPEPSVQTLKTARNVLNQHYNGSPSQVQVKSTASNSIQKPVSKNSASKDRAKKRKGNTLANLLKQKKSIEESKKKSSLNLADFLKK